MTAAARMVSISLLFVVASVAQSRALQSEQGADTLVFTAKLSISGSQPELSPVNDAPLHFIVPPDLIGYVTSPASYSIGKDGALKILLPYTKFARDADVDLMFTVGDARKSIDYRASLHLVADTGKPPAFVGKGLQESMGFGSFDKGLNGQQSWNFAFAALLTIGVIIVVYRLIRALFRRIRGLAKRGKPAAAIPAKLVSSKVVFPALHAQSPARDDLLIRKALDESAALKTDLASVRKIAESVATRLATLGTRDELEAFARDAAPSKLFPIPLATIEQRMTSCANAWRSGFDTSRKALIAMAEAVDLKAQTWQHRETSGAGSQSAKYEYEFEVREKGSWFVIEVPDSSEIIAIPMAAASFQDGNGPELLHRLFDGMSATAKGFAIAKVFQPCRLRPIPSKRGRYDLVGRGLLQLRGEPVVCAVAPPDYDSLRRGDKASGALASASVMTSLTDGLRQLGEGVRFMQNAIAAVESDIRTLKYRPPAETEVVQISPKAFSDLKARTSKTEKRLEQVSSKLDRLTSTPKARTNRPPPPAAPKEEAAPRQRPLPPANWQSVVNVSQPDNALVTGESFASALYQMAGALQALDGQTSVRLIHLQYFGDEFSAHETEMLPDGAIHCRYCQTNQTWQLAVCIGKPGDEELLVLFPAGPILPQHYPGAYRALIARSKSTPFRIARVDAPALLLRAENDEPVYTVTKQMQWSE